MKVQSTLPHGNAECEGVAFEHVEAEETELSGATFRECRFVACKLPRSVFRQCLFDDCEFVDCDLTMLQPFDTRLRGVSFQRSKLMGVDWTKAHALTFDVRFDHCVLDYGGFSAMKLNRLVATHCRAHNADFTEANLSNADFTDSDLTDAIFFHTQLTNTDLSCATGCHIDAKANRLKNTKLGIDAALRTLALLGISVPVLETKR